MAKSTDTTALPVDVATMRATAQLVLGPDDAPDVLPPPAEELEIHTATLRGHLELLAPEVEQAAGRTPASSVPRYCALACVGEARGKLRAAPGPGLSGAAAYARKLARVLVSLCDHYEALSSGQETAERAAFQRLADHCISCPTCKTVNAQGHNKNLSCQTAKRLDQEYRQARHGREGAGALRTV